MFEFEYRYTSSVGISRGKLYIILAALPWRVSRECRRSVFGQLPQTTSSYVTDGSIILKYKSNRAFRFKNKLLFKRFSLLTKFFFTSVRWCTQESLLSKVMPRRRVCFTHSIRSSPIVTEIRGQIIAPSLHHQVQVQKHLFAFL